MKNIKKYLSFLMVAMILLSSMPVVASNSLESEFNQYGFKDSELQRDLSEELNLQANTIRSMSLDNDWRDFASEDNVALDKKWTVKFSGNFNYQSIAAASIVNGSEFIPVNIMKSTNDQLIVDPVDNYSGNTEYSLRIVLANGKRYKKDFTTKDEFRRADIEPNNDYLNSGKMYLNETIIGSLYSDDNNDYYKIEVPTSGQLKIDGKQLDGGEIGITLYGENGTDSSYIRRNSRGQKVQLITGLEEGTYYIRVDRVRGEGNYTLETSFTENKYKNDQASANYIQAKEIAINDRTSGNIGHYRSDASRNNNDYYKIEVPTSGELIIDGKHLDGGEIGITLYNKYGTDRSYITRNSRGQKVQIMTGLEKGTYYIRVDRVNGYGDYDLDLKFIKQTSPNDNAAGNYIHAEEIDINGKTTGHIGHYRDDGSRNNKDFYKIELPSSGELKINGKHLNTGEMGITLYGENGTDSSYITRNSRGRKVGINRILERGTYYLSVDNSNGYGAYDLDLSFIAN